MTSAQVVDLKGKKLSEVTLSDAVFGIKPNMGVIHNALVRQLANARQGSANTKTRAEVRGGGRKPWRQKGTGRARAGSIRSPLWAGGGVPFGPKPRDYSITMNKKMRVLALKSALAASVEKLVVVQDFDNLKEAKTKLFSQVLKDLGHEGKKVLVVLDYACDACARVERAARNIDSLKVIAMSNLNVKDLLHYEVILTNARTLEAINNRFEASSKEKTEGDKPVAKKAAKVEAKAAPAAKAEKAPAK
ncbi:MAG: large subunit ribosomal protein, partial [Cyanobacteriota bacterium erpe_2018_sw_21hr_WHONDRS-SW48-000092_B_bin.40]|nr:large subunit ribosomal protein [Cyanobacteriota bacterium erpe_2018_sw_21hr_WHONDRS-SW48-000092_B_bin.40]